MVSRQISESLSESFDERMVAGAQVADMQVAGACVGGKYGSGGCAQLTENVVLLRTTTLLFHVFVLLE